VGQGARVTIDRRTVLRLMVPALLAPFPVRPLRADAAGEALFLIWDGIGPETPADRLRAFAAPFLDARIPVGVIADLPPAPDPALAGELRSLFAADPARVEPVMLVPGLAGLSPYFQRRAVSDAIGRLRGILGGAGGAAALSVATEGDGAANFDGLRALGIRSLLAQSDVPAVTSGGCALLEVCLAGGRRVAVADTPDPTPWIERALAAPGWARLTFSMAGIAALSPQEARLWALRAVDAISRELAAGGRFAALPRDHARWFGADQMRRVAIRLRPGPAGSEAAMARLASDLESLGLPFTRSVPLPGAAGGGWPAGACATLASPAEAAGAIAAAAPVRGLSCLAADAPVTGLAPEDADRVDLMLRPGADPAFDGQGVLVRGETRLAEAPGLLSDAGLMRDAILVLGPEDLATETDRQAMLATLARLREEPGTDLVDVAGFHAATVAPDPVFALLRETRRAGPEGPDPEPLSAEDLMADARQAWAFFERFTVARTGLTIDTADVQEDETWLHREMTMWDIGSVLAGVMAAHELGLIGDADFTARAALVVDALPVTPIGGMMLPGAVISSDTGAVLSRDFNACDTGRLLSVLRTLDAHPLTAGISADKVAAWDLAGVVVAGHVHSVSGGRLVDRFGSHCAHYTARALRDRGVQALSPYEGTGEGPWTDRAMRLFESLSGLDPLGADPLLLEALEMGPTDATDLLADVLHGAQRREYEATGTLYCLSEAPLNRAPWFTYQGISFAPEGERWLVNATSDDPRFATPEFWRETLLVNTKAAYLWSAARPGAYATRLVRHVRDRARLEGLGFAPGVFAASGIGMPGYADVNTNGIVLEAIAFILRGRKPPAR
jgi:hypothetical protein